MNERKQRVQWTENEKLLVMKEVLKVRLEQPSITLNQCFQLAQAQALPPNRKIATQANQVPWLLEGVAQELTLLKAKSDVESIRREYEKKLAETEAFAQMSADEAIENASLSQLLGSLINRACNQQEKLESAILSMSSRLDQLGAKQPQGEQTTKIVKARFRIVVCGILPAQVSQIKQYMKKYEKWLELIAIDVDHLGRKLPDADVAILWTKFSSHAAHESFISQLGRDRIMIVDTKKGLNYIIDMIRDRAEWLHLVFMK